MYSQLYMWHEYVCGFSVVSCSQIKINCELITLAEQFSLCLGWLTDLQLPCSIMYKFCYDIATWLCIHRNTVYVLLVHAWVFTEQPDYVANEQLYLHILQLGMVLLYGCLVVITCSQLADNIGTVYIYIGLLLHFITFMMISCTASF